MFGSRDSAEFRARLTRLEAKLDLVMESLGLQLDLAPTPESGEIQAAIDSGRKLLAVKLLRGASGVGLAEAKRAIEDGSWPALLPGARD